jgi:hypothetical protein
MSTFNFDINNSKGWFDKLEGEYRVFLHDKTSTDCAINFSITAHHMNDWAKSELSEKGKAELAEKRK